MWSTFGLISLVQLAWTTTLCSGNPVPSRIARENDVTVDICIFLTLKGVGNHVRLVLGQWLRKRRYSRRRYPAASRPEGVLPGLRITATGRPVAVS
jgi:hypothetical protein